MKIIFYLICFCCTAAAQDWTTKFERSDFLETARYDESINYFKQLADHSEYAELITFGVSPQGRDLKCIIVSKDKAFTPADAKKTGKPVILLINGIHSGEIEGKDASMILLREILITKEKDKMLDDVILLIVPIFNVDGHERAGKYNRINQNGPVEMGWRTTAQNLNLNRDWMKADAPEMKAMLKLFSAWLPDFFIDSHTTDGADYQYTITYSIETEQDVYEGTSEFNKKYISYMEEELEKSGYLSYSYVYFMDWQKGFESGLAGGIASPRFSHSYAAIQNRPGLLIETHMLKPYKERVFSTKKVIETIIEFTSKHADELINLNKEADEKTIKKYLDEKEFYPLNFSITDKSTTEKIKGKAYTKMPSEISGKEKIVYSNRDTVFDVQFYNDVFVKDSVQAPQFYLIPGEWKEIVERMKLHGIEAEELNAPAEFNITRYKFNNVKYDSASFEGRNRVNFEIESYTETVTMPAGTYKVNTNQRTIGVILHLLEPLGEDSFLKWGFFNSIFEMKEYYEDYVMEKTAEEMLRKDPELKKEFEQKLKSDENFRNDPDERLKFFYVRSPYFDKNYCVYPIMRIEK